MNGEPVVPEDLFDPAIVLPAGKPKDAPIWRPPRPVPRMAPAAQLRMLLQAAEGVALLERTVPGLREDLERVWRTADRADQVGGFASRFALELQRGKAEQIDAEREARLRRVIDQAILGCLEVIFENLGDVRRRLCALEAAAGLPVGASLPVKAEERGGEGE